MTDILEIIVLVAPSLAFFIVWLKIFISLKRKLFKDLKSKIDNLYHSTIKEIIKDDFAQEFYLEAGIVGFLNGLIIALDLGLLIIGSVFSLLSCITALIGWRSFKNREKNKRNRILKYLMSPSIIAGQFGFLAIYGIQGTSETMPLLMPLIGFIIGFIISAVYFHKELL